MSGAASREAVPLVPLVESEGLAPMEAASPCSQGASFSGL